jgi:sporulation protein YlmC with PRC-barrel domain
MTPPRELAQIELHFHLMDRQVVDFAGQPIGKVDDVELRPDEHGRLQVTALLLGQQVLGERIGGALGRWMAGIAKRLQSDGYEPLRIGIEHVSDLGSAITIGLRRETLPTPPLEQWLGEHLINRIPGARDAG